MLEHHGKPGTQAGQLAGVGGMQFAVALGRQAQFLTCNDDTALVWFLQQVDAAQQRALARAGTADDADHIARMCAERDAFEHFLVAIALVQVFHLKFEGFGGHGGR